MIFLISYCAANQTSADIRKEMSSKKTAKKRLSGESVCKHEYEEEECKAEIRGK